MLRTLARIALAFHRPTIGFAAGSCLVVAWRLILTGGSTDAAAIAVLLWISLKAMRRKLDAIESRIAAVQAGPVEVEVLPMDAAA